MAKKRQAKRQARILGSFTKATSGAVAINFGISGGANCWTGCRHHPEYDGEDATNACYAVALEIRPDRTQLASKLERHQAMHPARVCEGAMLEIQRMVDAGKTPPWVRFSTAGSVPMPHDVDAAFRAAFRRLIRYLISIGLEDKTHLPTEGKGKTNFYRALVGRRSHRCRRVSSGEGITVRESLARIGDHTRRAGAVSWVAGDDITTGRNIFLRRIERAREECKERTNATGRKAIVCPAVTAGFRARMKGGKPNPRAKCGLCNACAVQHIDVCYPRHK